MAANTPDLLAARDGLRRLQLYLLEKAANAQARGLVVEPLPVTEIAEYAKAVTNAIVALETPATQTAPSAAVETQAQINAAIQKMIQEADRGKSSAAAPAAAGTAKS